MQQVPDAADIDWGYWKTKVEPELVTMFQNALKRAPSGLTRPSRPEVSSRMTVSRLQASSCLGTSLHMRQWTPCLSPSWKTPGSCRNTRPSASLSSRESSP